MYTWKHPLRLKNTSNSSDSDFVKSDAPRVAPENDLAVSNLWAVSAAQQGSSRNRSQHSPPNMSNILGMAILWRYTHKSTRHQPSTSPQDNHTVDATRRTTARVGALSAESSWTLQHPCGSRQGHPRYTHPHFGGEAVMWLIGTRNNCTT